SVSMWHGREPQRHFGGVPRSRRSRPITTVARSLTKAAARKGNTGKRPCRLIASSPILGVFIKFMAMFGNGQRIAMTMAIAAPPQTARLGHPETAHIVSFAAARGATFHGTSMRRATTFTTKASVPTTPASGLPGRLPLNSLHLYFLRFHGSQGLGLAV